MIGLSLLLSAFTACQQPQDDLEAVLKAERARVDVMARATPSVCSVMQLDSPGGGSGVIVDPLGFVVTNFHVVGKDTVKRMKVGLPDGNIHLATVLGVDPGSDLAVLLLDPRDGERRWPFSPLGDSDQLLIAENVFAMGNPFLLATDFTPTVTWGIVSGTHRYQPGAGGRKLVYPDCIQVDVPVNPGNSGGPLFNMAGEVVGINGRISVRDRGRVNVGVGFAIASNQIRNFLPDLMAGRFAEHGTLDLNAWFMRSPHGEGHGVFVQAVFEDSRVRKFGLELGDELTTLNGTTIHSANQLATLVGVMPAGTWVSLGFRPQLDGGGYGEVEVAEFALQRLDTGSSQNEDRLASAEHRRLALEALARNVGGGDPAAGSVLTLRGPDGETVTLRRLGDQLRIDDGATALVRTGEDRGFKVHGEGEVSDLSPEEQAKLERVISTNPWLWRGPQLGQLLDGGLLAGGMMVHGAPGFRVELPGDGEREVFFLLDGTAAGCRYRDPVKKALVELRVRGERTRLLLDGEMRPGWHVSAPSFDPPDGRLFERPVR